MTTTVDTRNYRAKQFVLECIEQARRKPLTPVISRANSVELNLLQELIPISAMGFRGVVLTGIVGKYLDPSFNPLSDFYNCNPRSIFEHGIYYALQESGIPCGKSDPLNVAKNIQKLDYDWAKGRRPEAAARAAVDYLKLLDKAKGTDAYENLLYLYFRKLIDFADYVSSQSAPLVTHHGEAPITAALRLAKFAVECPEGGTIPQFILGNLIELSRKSDSRYKAVLGVAESVFGTNTTSKKPADAWELLSDGKIGALYEITVKIVDTKRLEDCVENLRKLNLAENFVTFICRIPQDISSLPVIDGALNFKGVRFQFFDIHAFTITAYCNLPEYDRGMMMHRLESFVADVNRQLKTKQYWKENFGS